MCISCRLPKFTMPSSWLSNLLILTHSVLDLHCTLYVTNELLSGACILWMSPSCVQQWWCSLMAMSFMSQKISWVPSVTKKSSVFACCHDHFTVWSTFSKVTSRRSKPTSSVLQSKQLLTDVWLTASQKLMQRSLQIPCIWCARHKPGVCSSSAISNPAQVLVCA